MTATISPIAAAMHPNASTSPELDGNVNQAAVIDHALISTMRMQRLQDFLFHKITFLFALSVLLVLVGILTSLTVGAWPAFKEFGPAFITTIEWDPVNDKYGGMIAIVGTLATSFIALLILPRKFRHRRISD
jgi:phosphate transport system permease protein